MRVIACGPGYHGKYRDLYYSFDKKIINGLIRIGHSVIPFSDRQITRSMGGVKALGKIAVERQLMNLAYSYAPDAISSATGGSGPKQRAHRNQEAISELPRRQHRL